MLLLKASIAVFAWILSFSLGSKCPTWFYHPHQNDTECECGSDLNGIVRCDNVTMEVSILDTFCMTPFSEGNDKLVVGECFISERDTFSPKFRDYLQLPPNASEVEKVMCYHLHRRGRLCGECRKHFYMATYSYNGFKCVPCTSSWIVSLLKYIGVAYIPLTVFFLLIFFFHINTFSPKLNCVVVICQIITSPIFLRGFANHKSQEDTFFNYYVATVYGIWNLDFFRTFVPPICFPLSSLQVLALDYIVAIYPIFLLVLFYTMIALYERNVQLAVFLLKPFVRLSLCFRRQWDVKSSVINSFASFILLSFMKISSTSAYFLTATYVRDVHGIWHGYYVFIDPSIKYFSKSHWPYAITAIVICVIWVAFAIFLLLYPMMWFQRLLNKLKLNSLTLHTFMQCFQGHYRDRTDGGMECRYFSALYPLLQFSCFFVFYSSREVFTSPAFIVLLLTVIVLISSCTPYRHPFQHYNKIDVFLVASLLAMCVSEIQFLLYFSITSPRRRTIYFVKIFTAIAGHVPLAYFVVIIILAFIKKWRFKLDLLRYREMS